MTMTVPSASSPPSALIALDWGTSTLRAWRVAADGAVLESRTQPWGILQLTQAGFADGFAGAFAAITRGWTASVPAIACGMVGSRQGWREAPYLPIPASGAALAAGLLAIETGAGRQRLHLVPGLLDGSDSQAPDMMRGEETQAIGALPWLAEDQLLVMPGTHCKWVRIQDGRVASLRTMMTGELFAVLRRHSILGGGLDATPAPTKAETDDAFIRGVLAAHAHGALARLFSTRALTLTGALHPGCAADYLSGLLIGEELRLGAAALAGVDRVALTGEASLCERYARAFAATGVAGVEIIPDTALAGLLRIAVLAGIAPGLAMPAAHQDACQASPERVA